MVQGFIVTGKYWFTRIEEQYRGTELQEWDRCINRGEGLVQGYTGARVVQGYNVSGLYRSTRVQELYIVT
jgi:hypothetical protein